MHPLARTPSHRLPGTAAQRRSAERAEFVGHATGLAKSHALRIGLENVKLAKCSCTTAKVEGLNRR